MRFLVAVALLPACLPVDFVRTDSSYLSTRKATRPTVFLDRLPPRAYRSIGILQVNAGQVSLTRVVDAVAARGQQEGCDIVIDKALHRVTRLPSGDIRLADYVPIQPPVVVHPQPYTGPSSSETREFICGVYELATQGT